MKKKIIFIFLLLILLTGAISAANCIKGSYGFDNTGKTQTCAVRERIIPGGEEKFSTRNEVFNSINGKRQTLIKKDKASTSSVGR